MNINPELLSAIERNKKWIETKCRISEKCFAKRDELINEVYVNLYTSNKNFEDKISVNADAWVKKITTNVTATHIKQEIFEKSIFTENVKNVEVVHDAKVEKIFDLQVAINYINTNMNDRDREIMILYIMQEPHASIAEIIGLEVATITNRISILKKVLNDYLNKGII
jgi:DNA-directed RNA polymerase specialized sigma24 family protein